MGKELFFATQFGFQTRSLGKLDSTGKIVQVKDVKTNAVAYKPAYLTPIGGRLFFSNYISRGNVFLSALEKGEIKVFKTALQPS